MTDPNSLAELFLKMEEIPDERFESCCDSHR